MIRKFRELDDVAYPLKAFIMKNLNRVYATQNDADEIPSRQALLHLKHCELKANVKGIYFPAISFKSNFHWLQHLNLSTASTYMTSNDDDDDHQLSPLLLPYMWTAGPYLWPMRSFFESNTTLRGTGPTHASMGFGAAIHMSSVSEPGEVLFKLFGVIESSQTTGLPHAIVSHARLGRLTPTVLAVNTLLPWCSLESPLTHVSILRQQTEALKDFLWLSIPWIVRANPGSYPFLLPAPFAEDVREGFSDVLSSSVGLVVPSSACHYIVATGLPDWVKECKNRKKGT